VISGNAVQTELMSMNRLKTTLSGFIAALMLASTQSFAAVYKDSEFGFQLEYPSTWQSNIYEEGTDRIFSALSNDDNIAVRVRAIPLEQNR